MWKDHVVQGNRSSRSSQGRRKRTRHLSGETGLSHRQARNATPSRAYGVTVIHPGHVTALYQRHPGQHHPEPVYIYVDLDERCLWASSGEAWTAHDLDNPAVFRYQVGSSIASAPVVVPTADAAGELMLSMRREVSRMAAGYRPERDRHGREQGRLNRSARRAEDDLLDWIDQTSFVDAAKVGAWDPDATSGTTYDETYGITAATTDADLMAIENQAMKDFGPDAIPDWNVLIWDGLWEHLVEVRDGLAADDRAA
jgi:hypothetical protein